MTSPDRQRLAAALAKLDDPHIISLLLEAFEAPTAPDPAPEPTLEPIQTQLIEYAERTPQKYPKRFWTRNEVYQLRAMVNGGQSIEQMAQHFRRSNRAIEAAIKRHIEKHPAYQGRVRS